MLLTILATSTNDNNTKLTESPIASTAADTPLTDEHLKKRNKKDLNNNRKRSALYTVHSSTINSENSKKNLQKNEKSGSTLTKQHMTSHTVNIPMTPDQQNKGPRTDFHLEPDSNNSELTPESLATIPDSDFTNIEVDTHTRNTEFTSTASTSTPTLTYSQALTGQRILQQNLTKKNNNNNNSQADYKEKE